MSSEPQAKKAKISNGKVKNYKPKRKLFIEVGQRGFLATCNFREKDCIRECYNILKQYADELYGPESAIDNKTNEINDAIADDIADDLEKEVAAVSEKLKNKKLYQRFQAVDTGTTNCVFIRTTLKNPNELGARIVTDIADTREAKSRYLLRLIPVEVICHANVHDITKSAAPIFDNHFLKVGASFSIVFNKRYNNDLKRDDVIRELAALVQSKNPANRVDLKQPQKTVVVEIMKGLCCISVIEGYHQHKKYNLVELANVKLEKPLAITCDANSATTTIEVA